MISVADFQPLSITRINIFHRQPRFYRQIYHSSVDYLRHAITSRNLSFKKIVWRVFLWQHFYIVIFIFIAYCFVSQLVFIRLFRISLSRVLCSLLGPCACELAFSLGQKSQRSPTIVIRSLDRLSVQRRILQLSILGRPLQRRSMAVIHAKVL